MLNGIAQIFRRGRCLEELRGGQNDRLCEVQMRQCNLGMLMLGLRPRNGFIEKEFSGVSMEWHFA
jgi:hypothetical protein